LIPYPAHNMLPFYFMYSFFFLHNLLKHVKRMCLLLYNISYCKFWNKELYFNLQTCLNISNRIEWFWWKVSRYGICKRRMYILPRCVWHWCHSQCEERKKESLTKFGNRQQLGNIKHCRYRFSYTKEETYALGVPKLSLCAQNCWSYVFTFHCHISPAGIFTFFVNGTFIQREISYSTWFVRVA
jgi:hypothetical protein